VVMGLVLTWFVFKPYLRVQDERRKRIDGARGDAKSMQERAASMIVDYEARLTRAKQRGAAERLKLRAEGQSYERDLLARARDAGQQALGDAMRSADAQRTIARDRLLAEST